MISEELTTSLSERLAPECEINCFVNCVKFIHHYIVSALMFSLRVNKFLKQFFFICCRVILGGGVIKHHTCNANLMRNGAEFSVFINTGQVSQFGMTSSYQILALYLLVHFKSDQLVIWRSSMEVTVVQAPMKRCLGERSNWTPSLLKYLPMPR